jgi:hypothetical protein
MFNQSIIVHGRSEVFSGGPWTPLSLGPKLSAWFDANQGVYNDAGTTLAAPTDSGYRWTSRNDPAKYYEQSDSGKRGALAVGANGKRYLVGTGMTYPPSGDFIPSHPYSVTLLMQRGVGRVLSGIGNNWLAGNFTADSHAFFNGGFVANAAAPVGWFRSHAQSDGTTSRLYENNADVTTNPTAGSSLPGGVAIGDLGIHVEDFTGPIAQIVICNAILTSGERELLDAFLAEQAPT